MPARCQDTGRRGTMHVVIVECRRYISVLSYQAAADEESCQPSNQ